MFVGNVLAMSQMAANSQNPLIPLKMNQGPIQIEYQNTITSLSGLLLINDAPPFVTKRFCRLLWFQTTTTHTAALSSLKAALGEVMEALRDQSLNLHLPLQELHGHFDKNHYWAELRVSTMLKSEITLLCNHFSVHRRSFPSAENELSSFWPGSTPNQEVSEERIQGIRRSKNLRLLQLRLTMLGAPEDKTSKLISSFDDLFEDDWVWSSCIDYICEMQKALARIGFNDHMTKYHTVDQLQEFQNKIKPLLRDHFEIDNQRDDLIALFQLDSALSSPPIMKMRTYAASIERTFIRVGGFQSATILFRRNVASLERFAKRGYFKPFVIWLEGFEKSIASYRDHPDPAERYRMLCDDIKKQSVDLKIFHWQELTDIKKSLIDLYDHLQKTPALSTQVWEEFKKVITPALLSQILGATYFGEKEKLDGKQINQFFLISSIASFVKKTDVLKFLPLAPWLLDQLIKPTKFFMPPSSISHLPVSNEGLLQLLKDTGTTAQAIHIGGKILLNRGIEENAVKAYVTGFENVFKESNEDEQLVIFLLCRSFCHKLMKCQKRDEIASEIRSLRVSIEKDELLLLCAGRENLIRLLDRILLLAGARFWFMDTFSPDSVDLYIQGIAMVITLGVLVGTALADHDYRKDLVVSLLASTLAALAQPLVNMLDILVQRHLNDKSLD